MTDLPFYTTDLPFYTTDLPFYKIEDKKLIVDKLLHLVDELSEIEKKINIKLLRIDVVLLVLIKKESGNPVKYYLNKSGISSRWFNIILKKLMEEGLVS